MLLRAHYYNQISTYTYVYINLEIINEFYMKFLFHISISLNFALIKYK